MKKTYQFPEFLSEDISKIDVITASGQAELIDTDVNEDANMSFFNMLG